MEHASNEYKALHDPDHFLLRYGPTDVGPYVTDDPTVSKYYGTLSVYSELQEIDNGRGTPKIGAPRP